MINFEETPNECYDALDYTDEINDLITLIIPLAIRDEAVENNGDHIVYYYENYEAIVQLDDTVRVIVKIGGNTREYCEEQMAIEQHILEMIEKEREAVNDCD